MLSFAYDAAPLQKMFHYYSSDYFAILPLYWWYMRHMPDAPDALLLLIVFLYACSLEALSRIYTARLFLFTKDVLYATSALPLCRAFQMPGAIYALRCRAFCSRYYMLICRALYAYAALCCYVFLLFTMLLLMPVLVMPMLILCYYIKCLFTRSHITAVLFHVIADFFHYAECLSFTLFYRAYARDVYAADMLRCWCYWYIVMPYYFTRVNACSICCFIAYARALIRCCLLSMPARFTALSVAAPMLMPTVRPLFLMLWCCDAKMQKERLMLSRACLWRAAHARYARRSYRVMFTRLSREYMRSAMSGAASRVIYYASYFSAVLFCCYAMSDAQLHAVYFAECAYALWCRWAAALLLPRVLMIPYAIFAIIVAFIFAFFHFHIERCWYYDYAFCLCARPWVADIRELLPCFIAVAACSDCRHAIKSFCCDIFRDWYRLLRYVRLPPRYFDMLLCFYFFSRYTLMFTLRERWWCVYVDDCAKRAFCFICYYIVADYVILSPYFIARYYGTRSLSVGAIQCRFILLSAFALIYACRLLLMRAAPFCRHYYCY